MSSGREIYKIWAPRDSVWSDWVSPSLFAQMECADSPSSAYSNVPPLHWTEGPAGPASAVVIDLPGAESARFAVALAKLGYRPVLLNNASPGPRPGGVILGSTSLTTYNALALTAEICAASNFVGGLDLPALAPPVFFLDSRRLEGERAPRTDILDNRWMVFPQDFPTARFLIDKGIRRVILLQEEAAQPQNDLSDVLLGWQRAGIAIFAKGATGRNLPEGIVVRGRNRFSAFIENILARIGLRQGSVGGFGSSVSDFTRAG